MPQIKHAQIRFRIIDRCLRNKFKPFPNKQFIREACEEAIFGSINGEHISNSTIEKDLFNMKMELDAPIKFSKSKGGYYYSDPDYTINDIPLSEEDKDAIQFATYTLMQFKDVGLFKQFGSAIEKIFNKVSTQNFTSDISENQFIQFETVHNTSGSEFLSPLLQAIQNNVYVTFLYASFVSGLEKQRKVQALLLKEYRNRWYLICFDTEKNDITTYSLDRIRNLSLTHEQVIEVSYFNAEDYFKYAVGITANNRSKACQVVFKANSIAAKYIDSQPFHFSQKKVYIEKDYVTFHMNVYISEELIRNLLFFGPDIEVIQPQLLRNEMINRITRMIQTYAVLEK